MKTQEKGKFPIFYAHLAFALHKFPSVNGGDQTQTHAQNQLRLHRLGECLRACVVSSVNTPLL